MFGAVTHEVNKTLKDLSLREYVVILPLVFLAFWIGIYPKPFFAYIEKPVQKIVEQVNPRFYEQANRSAAPQSCPRPLPPMWRSSRDLHARLP